MNADEGVDRILSARQDEAAEFLRPLVDDLARYGFIKVGS